ncbi:GntR family transcriptional regulator [Limobrevibacterium gyesilva]|uniref:GntR family transcriptional regulator n=1 Tax=Limobrevibacterium gyesilva TaxID=2991712 RepID=A0AA41YQZ8_9PROT|nr:GntR family transcriptional regulator [Limobrevibacterium gyesilva]MCW3474895.1 GntR family transcriptional regulator [Limobrevibacterium gyesilva]
MNRNRSSPALPLARTTPDLIADALRADIAQGELPPGEALRQEELAERFSVSRIPIREALRRLEAEGLVVVHPNRGAYVSRLDAAEVQEIYELRILLECDLLERAMSCMSRDDLLAIETILSTAEHEAHGPRWSELDDRFHETLYAPARRPRHLAMVLTLRSSVKHYQNAYAALPRNTVEWLRDHRAIVTACRTGNCEAALRRLKQHLTRAGRLVIDNFT